MTLTKTHIFKEFENTTFYSRINPDIFVPEIPVLGLVIVLDTLFFFYNNKLFFSNIH